MTHKKKQLVYTDNGVLRRIEMSTDPGVAAYGILEIPLHDEAGRRKIMALLTDDIDSMYVNGRSVMGQIGLDIRRMKGGKPEIDGLVLRIPLEIALMTDNARQHLRDPLTVLQGEEVACVVFPGTPRSRQELVRAVERGDLLLPEGVDIHGNGEAFLRVPISKDRYIIRRKVWETIGGEGILQAAARQGRTALKGNEKQEGMQEKIPGGMTSVVTSFDMVVGDMPVPRSRKIGTEGSDHALIKAVSGRQGKKVRHISPLLMHGGPTEAHVDDLNKGRNPLFLTNQAEIYAHEQPGIPPGAVRIDIQFHPIEEE